MAAEENQMTWRERNRKMHADGTLNYLNVGCLRVPVTPTAKAALRVKFICAKMLRYCPWFELHHPNMEEYCTRHGYVYKKDVDVCAAAARAGYIWSEDRDQHHVEERIVGGHTLLLEELSDCDLLVTLGGDTVVTNMTSRLEDIMPATAHFAITKSDSYECDAIIIRNSPEGKSLLEDWLSWITDKDHQVWRDYGDFIPYFASVHHFPTVPNFVSNFSKLHDDDVLTAVVERYPEHAARVHTFDAKQKLFAVTHVHWRPGDFIMHTPGTDDADRVAHLCMGLHHVIR